MKRTLLLILTVVMVVCLNGNAATIGFTDTDLVYNAGTGDYSAKLQYDTYSDGYYLNENYSTAFISTWQNGVDSSSCASRNDDGGAYWLAAPDWGSESTVITWKFDFSATGKTITGLSVRNDLLANMDGSASTAAEFLVSTDGTTWNQYVYRQATPANPSVTDGGAYHDLTSYVEGSDVYYIRAILQHFWGKNTPQIFRTGTSSNYDVFVNDVTLVPEPVTMCLLAAGAIGVLRIKRRK